MQKPNLGYAARLIAAMCAAEVLSMAGSFSFPTLLPSFKTLWGLSNTEAGWINGIYFGGYALAVPLLAGMTDRVDARRFFIGGAVLSALSCLGFAALAQGFWSALAFRVLGGLGLAGTYIPGLKALVDRIEGRAQLRAVSLYTAFFSLGMAGSFFLTGRLSERWGWQPAYAAAAGFTLLAAILAAWALPPRRPAAAAPPPVIREVRAVVGSRTTSAYILGYAAHTWEMFAFRSWIVALLTWNLTRTGDRPWVAPDSVAALAALIAMWASVGGAELAIRLGRVRTIVGIMTASILVGSGVGFASGLPYPVLALLCVLYTILLQADSAALHTGLVLSAPPERRGLTMAVQSFAGFAAAGTGPLVVGLLLDAAAGRGTVTWGLGFLGMTAGAALGVAALVVLRPADGDASQNK